MEEGANFFEEAAQPLWIIDQLFDHLLFRGLLPELEALAAGAFGGLAIGDTGQTQEGVGWVIEQLISGTPLDLPEGTESVKGSQDFGSIFQGGGVFELFDLLRGAFGAKFFEVEFLLSSEPVFVAAFPPAAD